MLGLVLAIAIDQWFARRAKKLMEYWFDNPPVAIPWRVEEHPRGPRMFLKNPGYSLLTEQYDDLSMMGYHAPFEYPKHDQRDVDHNGRVIHMGYITDQVKETLTQLGCDVAAVFNCLVEIERWKQS